MVGTVASAIAQGVLPAADGLVYVWLADSRRAQLCRVGPVALVLVLAAAGANLLGGRGVRTHRVFDMFGALRLTDSIDRLDLERVGCGAGVLSAFLRLAFVDRSDLLQGWA